MYTVLLVDDEESVLQVLRSSIDWQELGVDTLLTASDGLAALELFERRQIDLLVTDISMPVMDGLTLLRHVRGLRRDTHCVLLTAYGEFQYAKEAIRLGVDNYLLKPVAKDEVVQTIRATLDNIYQNRRNSATLLKENTLRRWAAGSIGSEELSERAVVLGLNLYQPAYCTVCLVKRSGGSIALFRSACAQALGERYDVNGFWDENGYYVLLLGGKAFVPKALEEELEALTRDTRMHGSVRLAVGPAVSSAESLHSSYQMACDAIKTADPAPGRVVIPVDPAEAGLDMGLLAEQVRGLLYEPSAARRQAGFRHLADRLRQEGPGDAPARLTRVCLHVLATEFPLDDGAREKVRRRFQEQSQPPALLGILEQTYGEFCRSFALLSPMVQRAVLYIRGGVAGGSSVSIKEFCAKNRMSPAYLGHIFKKETGVFFSDYLLRCRIDRSVTLLHDPEMKIKDIAQEVGFTSTSYYVKCFRERKGTSPAKYRQTWGGGEDGPYG